MKMYNVEYVTLDLEFIQNDTVDFTLQVYKNGVLFDMTGMILNMTVKDITVDANVIKAYASDGSDPTITISTSSFRVLDDGFVSPGSYVYDVQVTNGSEVFTIIRGNLIVLKEITP
jgi:hypothetical protein